MSEYKVIEELAIGDKKRRLDYLLARFMEISQDPLHPELVDVMKEMTNLQKEVIDFRIKRDEELIDDLRRENFLPKEDE